MDDFKNICITYFIILGLILLLSYFKISGTNWLVFPLINLIALIVLVTIFIKFNVNLISVLIFFSILLLLMMIIAIDSNSLFGKYSDYGLYIPKLIFPLELLTALIILTLPFEGIFIFLKQYSLLNYSCLIVPIYIIVIVIVVVITMKLFRRG
ncbi:hypothetical protein [Clostridium sp. JS66]|uniref:hypothetical protein n=1 Tax=Clostridium sp. JS66 TaxID=3064705 RepID=UPI00298EBC5A|nr:hypothetical protein [Clostridium sp. JS66]WPC42321.1 hypothetical protein Q6H37_02305 [Clostridium sp. JS66]